MYNEAHHVRAKFSRPHDVGVSIANPFLVYMKFTIKTIGCKVNTYESNKIRDDLINLGLEYVDVDNKDEYKRLDFYIVNTCSVTAVADKKSRQMLHLAKRYNPNVKTIAIGCLVDSLNVNKKTISNTFKQSNEMQLSCTMNPSSDIDYYISNKEKLGLVSLITYLIGDNNKVSTKHIPVSPRAFIKIEDGCDEYCTYCLIPYLRGHIKSRDDDDIIDEIREKVRLGVKEVVLTGIHLSSFGLDRKKMHYESAGAIDIAREAIMSIIKKIASISIYVDGDKREIMRIRLGSLEPRIISESLMQFFMDIDSDRNSESVSEKICHNFCLSLQSGSDNILKRMNRHYTVSEYKNACELIRKYMPDATITTDVIVGFPGESERDFNDSLEFVKNMRFYNPNIFPYSKREGTKAADFKGHLTQKEKHDRVVKMIKECDIITKEIEQENSITEISIKGPIHIGDIIGDILIEEIIEEDGTRFALGYTKNYIKRKIKV